MKAQNIINVILGTLIVAIGIFLVSVMAAELKSAPQFMKGTKLPAPTTLFVFKSPIWIGLMAVFGLLGILSTFKVPAKAPTIWLAVAVFVVGIMACSAVAGMLVLMPSFGSRLP